VYGRHAAGHGAVRGQRWTAWRRGRGTALYGVMRLREHRTAVSRQPETAGWIYKESLWVFVARATVGSVGLYATHPRPRAVGIMAYTARQRPLRDGLRRCRPPLEVGTCVGPVPVP